MDVVVPIRSAERFERAILVVIRILHHPMCLVVEGRGAVAVDDIPRKGVFGRLSRPSQQMIPHDFDTGLRNRKWNAAVCALQSQSVIGESGAGSIRKRIVIDPLGRAGSPVCWVYVDPVIGMLFEEGYDSIGQLR